MANNGYKHTKEDKKRIAEKDANLSNVNEEYRLLKSEIEESRAQYVQVKETLNNAEKSLQLLQLDLSRANINNDVNEAKKVNEEIAKVKSEIIKIQVKAKAKKNNLDYLKDSLNEKIQELMNDPEIKQYLEYIVRSQQERTIKRAKNGLEQVGAKRNKLKNLQELTSKHSSLQNNLRGMIFATSQLNKFEAELRNPALTPDQKNDIENKILATKSKFDFNKDALFAYANKNNVDIELSDLDGLLNQKVKMDKSGHVDLSFAFGKEFDNLNSQENQFNKDIANAERYSSRLGFEPQKSVQEVNQDIGDFEEVDLENVPDNPARSKEIKEQIGRAMNPQPKLGLFARAKNWFVNTFRRSKQLPAPEQAQLEQTQPKSNAHSDYVNSLKYDVMKDLAAKYKREMEQDIKREEKAAKAKAKEDNDVDR